MAFKSYDHMNQKATSRRRGMQNLETRLYETNQIKSHICTSFESLDKYTVSTPNRYPMALFSGTG